MASLHVKNINDFALNELNRKNTYQGSELVEFTEGSVKFGLGFWAAEDNDQNLHPFGCLIAWTPDGWKTLAKLPPLWNDELAMYMGSETDDLKNYMWFIGEQFTAPLQNYLADLGENTVPLENWKKVLTLMATARLEGGRLEFDRTL